MGRAPLSGPLSGRLGPVEPIDHAAGGAPASPVRQPKSPASRTGLLLHTTSTRPASRCGSSSRSSCPRRCSSTKPSPRRPPHPPTSPARPRAAVPCAHVAHSPPPRGRLRLPALLAVLPHARTVKRNEFGRGRLKIDVVLATKASEKTPVQAHHPNVLPRRNRNRRMSAPADRPRGRGIGFARLSARLRGFAFRVPGAGSRPPCPLTPKPGYAKMLWFSGAPAPPIDGPDPCFVPSAAPTTTA